MAPILQPYARLLSHGDAVLNPLPTLRIRVNGLGASLAKRQSLIAVPSAYPYMNSGPAPGTVVGIVFGAVAGFLLLLYLLYTCFSGMGFGSSNDTATVVSASSVVTSRRKDIGRSPRRETLRERETIEVRRERTPLRERSRTPVRETVVVEEMREERRPSRVRESSRIRPEPDDEVVVIEEHSPPRRKSKRRERERERDRDGGYRVVDPMDYAGGDRPIRVVRGERRRSIRD
jgi:hypothetical protein